MSQIFLFLAIVGSIFEVTTGTNTCTWGLYRCGSSSQCISSRYRCDGHNYCTNRDDERNCPTACTESYSYRCNNGRCITRTYLCDGRNNCGDGSDEINSLCGGTVFPVRLVGGSSSNEGRVEVYYAEDRTWGTICDDGWDINDATVVCRQLGLPRATRAVSSAWFGQGTGPILLDNVACTGSELTLSKCSSDGWKTHDCHHGEDAGVICGGSSVPSLNIPLRCYQCSGHSGQCTTTTACSSNQRYCYKTTYDTTWGTKRKLMVLGCKSSCSTYDRNRICQGKTNCQFSCCTTMFCNVGLTVGSGGSSSSSCYSCLSTSSFKDCDAKRSLIKCGTGTGCYKMKAAHYYHKGCSYTSTFCSKLKSICARVNADSCKVHCCSGNACNAGSIQRFSIAVLLTCAVSQFLYYVIY